MKRFVIASMLFFFVGLFFVNIAQAQYNIPQRVIKKVDLCLDENDKKACLEAVRAICDENISEHDCVYWIPGQEFKQNHKAFVFRWRAYNQHSKFFKRSFFSKKSLTDQEKKHFKASIEKILLDYNTALALEPDHQKAIVRKGYALLHLGKNKEALLYLTRSIRHFPKLDSLYYLRAKTYLSLNLKNKASAECKKLKEIIPAPLMGQCLPTQGQLEVMSCMTKLPNVGRSF